MKIFKKKEEPKAELTPADWASAMPKTLEAAVFLSDRAVFLHSPEAPSVGLRLFKSLWEPTNEDLLKQLTDRFHARLN